MNFNFFSKKSILFFSLAFLLNFGFANASVTTLVDFNDTNDLTDKFNPSNSTQFTNMSTGGIGDTGSINVPLGSNEVWTTKQAYTVAGEGDIYTFSAYFKIQANSGYGGLGFTTTNTGNTTDSYGSPATGIGMGFHGGGGFFVNNRVNEDVSWLPDLVLGNWYKMILRVEATGSNQYDLNFKIYNSDANGVLGTLKTEQTTTVTNATVGGANIIYGYFSAAGSRMAKIDDFEMTLEGGATFIEAGAPVVTTTSVADVTTSTASSGGEVVDDQGNAVTVRGVCWDTETAPTTADDCTEDGTGEGVFTSEVTGLTSNTTYYLRAYATNGLGTTYGAEETFTTDADATAPVLTEVTPVTGETTLGVNTTYYFTTSELCELQVSQPTSSKGEVTVLAETVVLGQNVGITLTGMQEGGTYSFSFTCVDDANNVSNTLNYGPVTIRSSSSRTYGSYSLASLVRFNANTLNQNLSENSKDDNLCSSDLILTQNLNKGARNGFSNKFTGGVVKEAHILQKHLNRLGFNSGPEDGIIGPLTEGAIKRMQIFLNTKPDGDVGPMTRELINKSC